MGFTANPKRSNILLFSILRWLKCICLSPCGCAHYQGPVSAFVNNFMFGKTKYLLGKRAHTGVKSSNPGVAKLWRLVTFKQLKLEQCTFRNLHFFLTRKVKSVAKAIYNRLAHTHRLLVNLYSSSHCLKEVPIVKCNKSWSSEKLSISISISTEWLEKIHFDIWEYKFHEKDCRCSAKN